MSTGLRFQKQNFCLTLDGFEPNFSCFANRACYYYLLVKYVFSKDPPPPMAFLLNSLLIYKSVFEELTIILSFLIKGPSYLVFGVEQLV